MEKASILIAENVMFSYGYPCLIICNLKRHHTIFIKYLSYIRCHLLENLSSNFSTFMIISSSSLYSLQHGLLLEQAGAVF